MKEKDLIWMISLRVLEPSGVHEEDGLELFWATKIGGPSHGFDVEGQCHLPLLANARSKVRASGLLERPVYMRKSSPRMDFH